MMGVLGADPISSGDLQSLHKESYHSSAIFARDFQATENGSLQPQPPSGTQSPQALSCYVLPEALSMPSPLPLLGINLDMNLLVQDVGMGPICATGVGLMFGSTLHNR